MKKLSLFLLTIAFLCFTSITTFAGVNDATTISGNYSGSFSIKTFFESNNGIAKVKSDNQFDVQLLFNGKIFIFQSEETKCMGNYTLDGDIISFDLTSIKGDETYAKVLFNQNYKLSLSNNRLMLISLNDPNSQLIVCQLNKINS